MKSLNNQANNKMRLLTLSELVLSGVAFHHAGLDVQDRKTVEGLFIHGDIPVLC